MKYLAIVMYLGGPITFPQPRLSVTYSAGLQEWPAIAPEQVSKLPLLEAGSCWEEQANRDSRDRLGGPSTCPRLS